MPDQRGRLDAILLCAAAQLIFLKSPPHAVINLSVFQVREDPQARRFSRLANAVLRRISEQGAGIAALQDEAMVNTPEWLWERWGNFYGAEEAAHIATQHLAEPPLDLSVKSDPQGWAERARRRRAADRQRAVSRRRAASRRWKVSKKANGGCRTPPQACRRSFWAT